MNAPGHLGLVLKAAWVVSAVAAAAMALFIVSMTALYFDMSDGQPLDTYTGQDWDRAASSLMLALSMAATAVAVLTGYVPARLRRLRAQARGAGLGLLPWLGAQRPAFLFGNLLAVNLPLGPWLLGLLLRRCDRGRVIWLVSWAGRRAAAAGAGGRFRRGAGRSRRAPR